MMTKFLAISCTAAIALVATPASTAPKPRTAPFQTPFFVAMMVGDDEIVVGENGPLEAVARCFSSVGSGFLDRSRLYLRSSVDGWAITRTLDSAGLYDLPAGEQPIGGQTNNGPEISDALGASALAPDGSMLTVLGNGVLVGMHVFQDFDCVMAGVVTTINGGSPAGSP